MNVRELVNVIKFKTDTATMKAAESAVNRIKTSMSKIPAMKLNTGKVTNQLNAIGNKMRQISTPRTIKIGSDTIAIQRTIDKLNELDRTNQRVVRGHYKAKTQGIQQQPSSGGGMSALAGGLKGAFVALGGMAIVSEIKETADAMMSLSSRIKLVTKDDAERLRVEGALYAMANRNRASLQDLGDLYYKTASSAKQFGASQEDVLKLTDIVSKSLIVGGADTAQQKSTILQLSQALSSGVLQGDELRSLRENAPRLMQEIAKNMGTNMAGLKEMGANGELTTEKLMQAILQSGGAIEGEFARMTPTIGQALTVLGNKWDKFVLDIQNNTGFFGQIAQLILDAVDWVGQAIDWAKEEFKSIEPEFNEFMGNIQELWTQMKPLLTNLRTIFNNLIVPALRTLGKVAFGVFSMAADLLKPIVDLLTKISDIIVAISGGLPGILKGIDNFTKRAESGALEKYKSYMAEYNQNNTFHLSGGEQVKPAMQSTGEFFKIK